MGVMSASNQDSNNAEDKHSILEPSDKVYKFPEDLAVLDEVNVNVQIFDFTPGEEKNVWANKALCSLLGVTVEMVQAMNLIDCSETLRNWQKSLLQNIQHDRQTETSVKTISPGGKPITLCYTFRPIRLLLPETTEPRTVVFSTALPVNKRSEADDELIMCQEMMRYTDVAQMLVLHQTGKVVHSNQRARILWPELTSTTNDVTVRDILDGRAWASTEEKEEVNERYRNLTLQSPPFDVTCRVLDKLGETVSWRRMTFTPCLCPITGGQATVLNEVDTTDLNLQAKALQESMSREQKEAATTQRLLQAMIPQKVISKIEHFFQENEYSDDSCSDDEDECHASERPDRGPQQRKASTVTFDDIPLPAAPFDVDLTPNQPFERRPSSASEVSSCKSFSSSCASAYGQGFANAASDMLLNRRFGGVTRTKALYAEEKKNVTIIFSDVVAFSRISAGMKPMRVMDMLSDLFQRYDALCEKHRVLKVETIGDGCIMASGLLDDERDDPSDGRVAARRALDIAKEMIEAATKVRAPRKRRGDPREWLQIRVGIHVGPITCGVLGKDLPRFDVFGDTVNLAARMEQNGRPGLVHVSSAFRDLVGPDAEAWEEPRVVSIKNMGEVRTWLLDPGKGRLSVQTLDKLMAAALPRVAEEACHDTPPNRASPAQPPPATSLDALANHSGVLHRVLAPLPPLTPPAPPPPEGLLSSLPPAPSSRRLSAGALPAARPQSPSHAAAPPPREESDGDGGRGRSSEGSSSPAADPPAPSPPPPLGSCRPTGSESAPPSEAHSTPAEDAMRSSS